MKTFSTISFLLTFSALLGQNITINGTGRNVTINAPGKPSSVEINRDAIPPEWVVESTGDDDGLYNGFLMMTDAIGLESVGIFKKAVSHASAGPMTFLKTTNGGNTWTTQTVIVDGIPVSETLNYSIERLSSGRIVISYRNTSGVTTIAHSDDGTHNFISTQTFALDSAGAWGVYQSPIKMIETSFGKIFLAFYKVGINGNPAEGLIYESSDDGLTFTYKSTIYSHNSLYPNNFGDYRGNEIALCETHPTGVEATSKFIALVRTEIPNEGGSYPMHFFSSNGGATWATDLVNRDPGSFVDDLGNTISNPAPGLSRHILYSFLGSNSPFDIRLHNGLVYVANGERRAAYGFARKWITATPDGAFRNKFDDWIRPVFDTFYNAGTLGASHDCGYEIWFEAGGHLYTSFYDVSLLPRNPAITTRRCFVGIKKIIE